MRRRLFDRVRRNGRHGDVPELGGELLGVEARSSLGPVSRGELEETMAKDPLDQPVTAPLYRGGNSFSMEKSGKYVPAAGPADRLLVQASLGLFEQLAGVVQGGCLA